MKIGAQLFTVRAYTQTEKDFAYTIDRIAKMGYTTVQISAISKDIKPERVREICDPAGLSIVLTHSDVNRILNDTDRLIEEHNIMGCDHIGIGMMAEKYRSPQWLYHFALDYKEPAKKIAAAGKLLMYHNHDFEFCKMNAEGAPDASANKRVIEYLADWFAPDEMGFTLDTYWVQSGGGDVCQWIRQLKDRIPVVHLKDMGVLPNGQNRSSIMAPVMEGNLNFPAILAELENTCCKYAMVEQDVCQTSPFDCLKLSYDNLVKAGYR